VNKLTELDQIIFEDYPVYTGGINDTLNSKNKIINTINPHSYIVSKSDKEFYSALKESDVLLPDGAGIIMAVSFLYNVKIRKITGPDFMNFLLNHGNKKNHKVFFLGSSVEVLNLIQKKCLSLYPNLSIDFYSPPYSSKFTLLDNKVMIDKINLFGPDVLFVGMTAPKQEKWVYMHKNSIKAKKIVSVGAAFDWFSGLKSPPLEISKKFHLSWLERFIREPVRMAPRIKSMLHFLYIIFSLKLKSIFKR
jgi:N-acetylglucosaminyldiphosphoundecaprenol N-acetyl-beta-D-mannosaminyltransferase